LISLGATAVVLETTFADIDIILSSHKNGKKPSFIVTLKRRAQNVPTNKSAHKHPIPSRLNAISIVKDNGEKKCRYLEDKKRDKGR
jgi:hypothetical protein